MLLNKVKKLWHQVPIMSVDKVADILESSIDDIQEFVLSTGIESKNEFGYRSKLVSYCLDGTHMKRCKYCSICLYDHPTIEERPYHLNISGYCPDCFEKYNPRRYNNNLSWYANMLREKWQPTNKGWLHTPTGRFLKREYMTFFMENHITP